MCNKPEAAGSSIYQACENMSMLKAVALENLTITFRINILQVLKIKIANVEITVDIVSKSN